MRWTKPTLAAAAAAAAALTAALPALAADVVVIRATGPSAARYTAGATIPGSTRLVLRKGDQLVLLDAHGTRTVSGPGSFPAAAAAATAASGGSTSALIALAGTGGDRRDRVGAVRNLPTGGAALRPNIFLVDVAAPGPMCVTDTADVTLWRGAADVAGSSTIVAPDGRAATVAWIKGQSTQPWPAALPVTAAGAYRVTSAQSTAAAAAPVAITFQRLAGMPADLPQLAKELIAHGCTAQVDVVVATTGAAG